MLSSWSRRSVLACAVGWAVLITTYLLLAALGHEPLPSPYNGLLIALLSTSTIVSVVARFTSYLDERLTAAERRDALLYAQAGRMENRMRHFIDGPTLTLVRPERVVATIPPVAGTLVRKLDPEVLDLTRRIRENQQRDA